MDDFYNDDSPGRQVFEIEKIYRLAISFVNELMFRKMIALGCFDKMESDSVWFTHLPTRQNGPPFHRRYFQMHFREIKVLYLI